MSKLIQKTRRSFIKKIIFFTSSFFIFSKIENFKNFYKQNNFLRKLDKTGNTVWILDLND